MTSSRDLFSGVLVVVGGPVGVVTGGFNTTELPADPGLALTAYTSEPGCESAEKLALLTRPAVIPDRTQSDSAAEEPEPPLARSVISWIRGSSSRRSVSRTTTCRNGVRSSSRRRRPHGCQCMAGNLLRA
jgi:hypothetical protein